MELESLSEKALARLKHTDEHFNDDLGRLAILTKRIISREENEYACFLGLQSYCVAKGISTWFHTGDLVALKNCFYARAKLEYICANPPFNKIGSPLAYENRALEGMFYLVSDHEKLIQWYANFDSIFDKKGTENTKSYEFYTKQFFLALRGDWDVLGERCERILANPPKSGRGKSYMIDHRFYLALAKGDAVGMEAVIKELVTPKQIAYKASLEGGFTENLISTPAIIYSKLAWRNGYEIVVDSPYIPQEWLPIKPLDTYADELEFMKEYTIG